MIGNGTPASPPGWHDDPYDPAQLRYWDGHRWTGHSAPKHASAASPGAVAVENRPSVPRWVWITIAVIATLAITVASVLTVAMWPDARAAQSDLEVVPAPVEWPAPEWPAPEDEPVSEDESLPGDFGPGVYVVGEDIEAGTYRTVKPVVLVGSFVPCYWQVSADASGAAGNVLANNAVTGGFSTVTVVDGQELDVRECGGWERVDPSTLFANEDAGTVIREGTWLVGEDIAPGTYQTDDEITADGFLGKCFWTIGENLENNFLDVVEEDSVGEGRPTVTLETGQQFDTFGCGNWSPA